MPCRPSPPIPISSWWACGSTPTTRPGATPARSADPTPSGVVATQDADALLFDTAADCICYTANSDLRPDGVVDDLCRMLATGINVVNTSYVPLLYPAAAGPGVLDRLQAACLEGGTSFYTSGIDPGYGNAGITIPALALCKDVQSVRMMEIVNYDTWDNPFTMFEIMGFGKPDTSTSLLLAPGSTTLAWGPVLGMVAAALDVELDEIVEWHEVIHADEEFSIASGPIPVGGISGMRFEIRGMVGGEARIVVEHVTRLPRPGRPGLAAGPGVPHPRRGRAVHEDRARAVVAPRRPQPRRLPGHRDARGQRHPAGRGGRSRAC